jgi:hypothetical protein
MKMSSEKFYPKEKVVKPELLKDFTFRSHKKERNSNSRSKLNESRSKIN